jgi:nucleoside-diphosphate-sugar epimerase
LYDHDHGAHAIYLSRERWAADPDGLINQVHYSDAAAAVVSALRRPSGGETLLVADDLPMSRSDICRAALRLPTYRHLQLPIFNGGAGGIGGKVCDSSRTRSVLEWQPRYRTFEHFVDQECDE